MENTDICTVTVIINLNHDIEYDPNTSFLT